MAIQHQNLTLKTLSPEQSFFDDFFSKKDDDALENNCQGVLIRYKMVFVNDLKKKIVLRAAMPKKKARDLLYSVGKGTPFPEVTVYYGKLSKIIVGYKTK